MMCRGTVQVLQALADERHRAEEFVHTTTVQSLVEACQQVLVDDKISLFHCAFGRMLRSEETEGKMPVRSDIHSFYSSSDIARLRFLDKYRFAKPTIVYRMHFVQNNFNI